MVFERTMSRSVVVAELFTNGCKSSSCAAYKGQPAALKQGSPFLFFGPLKTEQDSLPWYDHFLHKGSMLHGLVDYFTALPLLPSFCTNTDWMIEQLKQTFLSLQQLSVAAPFYGWSWPEPFYDLETHCKWNNLSSFQRNCDNFLRAATT